MILTVGTTKGGVGKSTLAVQIAIARALQGRDVWLVDTDPQASAISSIAARAEAGTTPDIAADLYTDDKTLRQQVRLKAPKFDDVVIDVGGKDAASLRAALVLSDAVLVPFEPSSYDTWAMSDMAALVDLVREAGKADLQAFAVLNRADSQGKDNEDAAAAVAAFPAFKLLNLTIGDRKAIKNASTAGLHVSEQKPVNAKAVAELQMLIEQLFHI